MSNLVLLKWTDSNNKKQRIQIISEFSPKWIDISDLLGFSTARIQQIRQDNSRVQDRCKEVMRLWLDSEEGAYRYPTTWEGFIELLEDIELSSLASEIQDVVCQTTTVLSKSLELHII